MQLNNSQERWLSGQHASLAITSSGRQSLLQGTTFFFSVLLSFLQDLEKVTLWGRVKVGEIRKRLAIVTQIFGFSTAYENREPPSDKGFWCSETTVSLCADLHLSSSL